MTSGDAETVQVIGSVAYVVGDDFEFVGVSDPSEPVLLGALDDTPIGFARVVDGLAYVRVSADVLQVLDVSDPAAPVALNSIDISAFFQPDFNYAFIDIHSIEMLGSTAVIYTFQGLTPYESAAVLMLELSDPMEPRPIGARKVASAGYFPDDVHLAGEIGFFGAWSRASRGAYGLSLVDLSDCPPGCVADVNGDGELGFDDLVTFLSMLTGQHPGADQDPAWRPDGQFGFFDLVQYLTLFALGCP